MSANTRSNANGPANIPNVSNDSPNQSNVPDVSNQTIDEWANIAFPSPSTANDDHPSVDDVADDEIAAPSSSLSRDDVPSVSNQADTDVTTITDDESDNPVSSIPQQLNYDNGQCAICLDPQLDKSRPNCGHVFCFDCLKEWCRVKLECPTCRQPFTSFVHKITGTANNEVSQVYTPDAPPVRAQSVPVITITFPPEWAPLLRNPLFQQFLLATFSSVRD